MACIIANPGATIRAHEPAAPKKAAIESSYRPPPITVVSLIEMRITSIKEVLGSICRFFTSRLRHHAPGRVGLSLGGLFPLEKKNLPGRRPKSVRAPFHGTSARETGECAAADEDAASSTARLGARRDQQISVDILSVLEDG